MARAGIYAFTICCVLGIFWYVACLFSVARSPMFLVMYGKGGLVIEVYTLSQHHHAQKSLRLLGGTRSRHMWLHTIL